MLNKEKITNRIKNLLALSKSNNLHEAQAAMDKANELMKQHQITMSEVLVDELSGKKAALGRPIRVSEVYRSFVDMIASAAAVLCDACNLKGSEQASVVFIGSQQDVENAENLFWYLFNSWKSIVQADASEFQVRYTEHFGFDTSQYEVKKYKIGHGQGFSSAILHRARILAEERRAAVQASSVTGNQLVVMKDSAIKEYLENISESKVQYKKQELGFYEGVSRGQQIPLGGSIENKG